MGSADINGPLWSTQPADWAAIQEPNHAPLFEAMLTATNVGQGTRLLDVGCGGGWSSKLASNRGARVTGLDAAEGLIEYARGAVPGASFQVGDIEHLPFEDGTFDVVFAVRVGALDGRHPVAGRAAWARITAALATGGQVLLDGRPADGPVHDG